MTKIIALCGASASGKSMLCSAFLDKYHRTCYIRTTTTKVREEFNNPSYDYLCSPLGNSFMRKYQTAIADNLWSELLEAFEIAEKDPEKYDYIVLDRSPMDAYIYEELFSVLATNRNAARSRSATDIAFKAFGRLFNEYNYREIERHFPDKLYVVGLTSLFPSDDPKRPSAQVNEKYANEVRRIFNLSRVTNYPSLKLRALPNTVLDIDGRVRLLHNLLQDHYNEI